MKIGDRVRVRNGAYKGWLGTLQYAWIGARTGRAMVLVRLDDQSDNPIDLWAEDIEPGLLDELARI